MSLSRLIYFVLNQPSHPGNIGAAARALNVMGFNQLDLVMPDDFPSEKALARATHAKEILNSAGVYQNLDEALEDKNVVFALTARNRGLNWPHLDAREAAKKIWHLAENRNKVSIVFGREDSGLSNQDLSKSNYLVHILSKPKSNSLNLAQAVQIMAYELFVAKTDKNEIMKQFRMDESPAQNSEINHLLEHLNQLMEATGFLAHKQDKKLKIRLARVFHKAMLDKQEATLIRGIFASMIEYQNRINQKKAKSNKSELNNKRLTEKPLS